MKIIHTADLHLDSSFTTNFNPTQAAIRKKEILTSFMRLVQYATKNDVAIILIAGDMFDTPGDKNALIKQQVESIIAQNNKIDFLYLRGNHDTDDYFKKAGARLPNLKLFSSDKWTYYRYDISSESDKKTLVIAGREVFDADQIKRAESAGQLFYDDTSDPVNNTSDFYDSLKLNASDINIVTLHGCVKWGESKKSEIIYDLNAFCNKPISYMALGHIHSYKKDKLNDKGVYCYCGCLEGRGFDECGQKGFMLLDIDNARRSTKMKFIPFALREIFDIDVELSGGMTYTQVLNAITSATQNIKESAILRVNLTGVVTSDTQINIDALLTQSEQRFFYITIVDKTRLDPSLQVNLNEVSLKSTFIKKVTADPTLNDIEKRDIIRMGLEALGL